MLCRLRSHTCNISDVLRAMQRLTTSAVALYGGERRHRIALQRLNVTYAWLPPFEGASKTIPNRLEVVFSRHPRVAIEQAGTTLDVDVAAGSMWSGRSPRRC